ncbi:hypothetical protein CEXT_511281 [Caerostris extrusa]|uniref:Uncharacterized protein n=1 Tax=Caerostris extrusa TaxID=172846 RepID=A0AAV4WBL7_CAEEX|nr:hypothetical protein CEXT_511281 [Caerostris extrusa]
MISHSSPALLPHSGGAVSMDGVGEVTSGAFLLKQQKGKMEVRPSAKREKIEVIMKKFDLINKLMHRWRLIIAKMMEKKDRFQTTRNSNRLSELCCTLQVLQDLTLLPQ